MGEGGKGGKRGGGVRERQWEREKERGLIHTTPNLKPQNVGYDSIDDQKRKEKDDLPFP